MDRHKKSDTRESEHAEVSNRIVHTRLYCIRPPSAELARRVNCLLAGLLGILLRRAGGGGEQGSIFFLGFEQSGLLPIEAKNRIIVRSLHLKYVAVSALLALRKYLRG